jgi:hypothetical protein
MKSWRRLAMAGTLALSFAAVLAAPGGAAQPPQSPHAIRLFNGRNFDNWYTWINGHGKNSDPNGIFKVENGVIHVLGKEFGYLSTINEYDDFRFDVEFKWGQQKWPPRQNDARDAGVLYRCVGPDKVWMKSLEFQIQEQDCGDMWLTAGEGGAPALTVLGKEYVGGRVVKWDDYEKPNGEWNHVTVVAKGDKIVHWMNGKVNLVGTKSSLLRGKINLQSEGAEIYYRNVTVEPLR